MANNTNKPARLLAKTEQRYLLATCLALFILFANFSKTALAAGIINNVPICRAESHPSVVSWVPYFDSIPAYFNNAKSNFCDDFIKGYLGEIWVTMICNNGVLIEKSVPCRVTPGVTVNGHTGPILGWLSNKLMIGEVQKQYVCVYGVRNGDPGPVGGDYLAFPGTFQILDPKVIPSMFWDTWGAKGNGNFPAGSHVAVSKSPNGSDRVICAALVKDKDIGAAKTVPNVEWQIGFAEFPMNGNEGDGQGYCVVQWGGLLSQPPVKLGPADVLFLYTNAARCWDPAPDVTVSKTVTQQVLKTATLVATQFIYRTASVTVTQILPKTTTIVSKQPVYTTLTLPIYNTVFRSVTKTKTILKTRTISKK